MSDKAVIVSGGKFENSEFYREILRGKYIICADGGIYLLQKLNIKPDMFLGDTHIAVDFAVEKGFRDITLIGALGGRIDHSLANIMLLKYMLEKGVKGTVLNEKNKVFLTDKSIKIPPEHGRRLSLVPLTENVCGVTLKGLKYPLCGFTLTMGDSIGISNEFTDTDAEIIFEKGLLLVITSED